MESSILIKDFFNNTINLSIQYYNYYTKNIIFIIIRFLFQNVVSLCFISKITNINTSIMKKSIVLIIAIFIINIANAQTTIILRPDSTTGKYAIIPSLYPNDNYYNLFVDFAAAATTNGGNFTAGRSLIDFDLSSIPAMAVITGATLNLYSYNSPSNSTNLGDNVSYLQRITSSWNPMTVTWNTAPTTTTLHQVTLDASTSADEIYNVNVTNLVQDYVNDKANSFGFMLRLATEATYRRLVFGSSQNPDSTLRPKLHVCYSTVNGINKHNTKTNLSIYPNPTKDNLTIETNINTEQRLEITNLIGQTVYTSYIYNKKATINTSAFAKGVYILKLSSDKETVVRKFVKQ